MIDHFVQWSKFESLFNNFSQIINELDNLRIFFLQENDDMNRKSLTKEWAQDFNKFYNFSQKKNAREMPIFSIPKVPLRLKYDTGAFIRIVIIYLHNHCIFVTWERTD